MNDYETFDSNFSEANAEATVAREDNRYLETLSEDGEPARLETKRALLDLVFEQSIRRARSDIDLVAPIHDVRIIGIMQCLHHAEIKTIETFAETMFDENVQTNIRRSATIIMFRNLHGYQVRHAYKIDDSVEDLCIAKIIDSSPSRHSSLEKDESAWIAFKDMATLCAGQENMGLDAVFEPEARYVLNALEQSFYFKEET